MPEEGRKMGDGKIKYLCARINSVFLSIAVKNRFLSLFDESNQNQSNASRSEWVERVG